MAERDIGKEILDDYKNTLARQMKKDKLIRTFPSGGVDWNGINLPISMQAVFVCDALNRLYQQEDPCCPECCFPCAALYYLDQFHELDHIVKQARPDQWMYSAWMYGDDSGVNREWLFSKWHCESGLHAIDFPL